MDLSQGPSQRGVVGTRLLATLALVVALVPLASVAARADCQEDIGKLMKRRMSAVADLNSKAKTKNGKLDPVAACPRLKSLAVIEGEATAYMTKNMEWCNLPPDFVAKLTTSYKRTQGFATQACTFVVRMKQQQQQQAQQQQEAAPKLPAGPL